MPKTYIQSVRNERSGPIDYQVLENNGCNRVIPAGQTRNVGCDVPWVFNRRDFRKKRLEIQDADDGQVLAQIWQREVEGDDRVRLSRTGFQDPGEAIPGKSKGGGRKRLLVVRDDGVELQNIE